MKIILWLDNAWPIVFIIGVLGMISSIGNLLGIVGWATFTIASVATGAITSECIYEHYQFQEEGS